MTSSTARAPHPWSIGPLVLLSCCALAACHTAMSSNRRGTGGRNTGAGSGGSAGSTARGGAGGLAGTGGAPGVGGAIGSGGVRDPTARKTRLDAATLASGGATMWVDGGAGGIGGSATEPIDERLPRPDWKPAFPTPLGTPGWQASVQPICDANQGAFASGAFDLWADERGVFALVGEGCSPDSGFPCGRDGASIKQNAGAGWQLLYQFPPGGTNSPRLWPSVPGGPLLVSGPFGTDRGGVALFDNGISAFHPLENGYGAYGGFAVSADLAYVIDETKLLRYSGGAWSTVGDTITAGGLPLLAVWAGPQEAIVAGFNQTIATQAGSSPMAILSGVPVGQYSAVWAFGPDDVWFGNSANQLLHYDGSQWQAHATGAKSKEGIRSLWGAAGTLYFTTGLEFGRWNGAQVELLLQVDATQLLNGSANYFGTIWGRSVNEVFLAVRDARYRDNACGSAFALWFDGAQFHQF